MSKKQTKKAIQHKSSQKGVIAESPPTPKPAETEVAASPTLLENLDTWFRKHITWVFCALVLGWVGIRAVYYHSIVNSPLNSMYLLDESDNKFFDDWAKYLNTDWLNAKPLHPYHHWHKIYADYYLEQHPEKLAEINALNTNKDSLFIPGKALWYEWYRGNQYHQEPLYPYMLALFYHFHLNEVNAMMILQLLLGVCSGALVFLIARKYFGETAAVITGLLYLMCGILMYNEIILLRTSWAVFLTVLNVFVMDKAFSNQKYLNFFLCGLCIGFSYFMQSTFSLYLFGALLILFFIKRKDFITYLKISGALVLGYLAMLSPLIIRNKIVGAPAFSISSVGPADVIASNVYGTRSISEWYPSAERETEILGRTYTSIGAATVATLKTHPSVWSYISLELSKLKAAWVGIEYPNNENYYFYREFVPVLKTAFLNFFWIAPLGLAGLIFCIYYRRKYYPLYLAILIQLITLLVIFVLARFRAPLAILLLPLAAFAITECIKIRDIKQPLSIIKISLVAVLLYLSFISYSSDLNDDMITDSNYKVLYTTYYVNKLKDLKEQKQWTKWLELQQQLLNMEPGYVKDANANQLTDNLHHANIVRFFSLMHSQRSEIYKDAGDEPNAARELELSKTYNTMAVNSLKSMHALERTNDAMDMISLAQMFRDKKQTDSSILYFKKSFAIDPNNLDILKDIGNGYLDKQNYDSAEVYFKKILAGRPSDADGINGMGCIYFNRKQYPDAIAEYKKSVELDPKNINAYSNLGKTYFVVEQYSSAIEIFNKEQVLDPKNEPDVNFLALCYAKTGPMDSTKKYEAIAQKNDPRFKL